MPKNTIAGNYIGSKGHWREPCSELGTKLYPRIQDTLNLTVGKNPKCDISAPLTFRLLQGNKASYKIIQMQTIIYNIYYTK